HRRDARGRRGRRAAGDGHHRRRRPAARQPRRGRPPGGKPGLSTGTAPAPKAARPERVLTFGDVFGRDAGGLIVLLVLFGGMTLASSEFLTGDNLANLARQV